MICNPIFFFIQKTKPFLNKGFYMYLYFGKKCLFRLQIYKKIKKVAIF